MKNLIFVVLILSLITACTKKKSSNPITQDLDPRGVFRPLDNETDPNKVENWFTKGPAQYVEGVNAELAYSELNLNMNASDIIVAVIDSGVDVHHEDLKDRIWTNQAEVQGLRNVDDDLNGYIDDYFGWNFLGGIDEFGHPTHVHNERLETVRQLARLRQLKETNGSLSPADQAGFEKFDQEISGERKVVTFKIQFTLDSIDRLKEHFDILKDKLNVIFDALTIEDVEKLVPTTNEEQLAKTAILKEFANTQSKSVQRLRLRVDGLKQLLSTVLNEDFNPRAQVIRDDPDDFSDAHYGNNDVVGPDSSHGTHVAGIIAATRNNNLGINGISQFAKIMVLRAIPNGDEYDKDVYFAVKYAVDNGARIINMSFGKTFSPHKTKLDEVFKYSESRGVIIVHAAGNSALDNDKHDHFPNRYLTGPDAQSEIKTWIEVGASSRYNTSALAALFSNYGKNSVDIFAPGTEINSTIPGNKYATFSGTSMASPSVAGVVSLVMAQNPNMKSEHIRALVLESGRDKSSLSVGKPGSGEPVAFGQLCRTGMVVDSYQALKR